MGRYAPTDCRTYPLCMQNMTSHDISELHPGEGAGRLMTKHDIS